jgi:hypothetical protein
MAVREISDEDFLAGPDGTGLGLGVSAEVDDEISDEDFLAGPDGTGLGLDQPLLEPAAQVPFEQVDSVTVENEISDEDFLAGPQRAGIRERVEPDDEWKSSIKQANPREMLGLLESLPPDTDSIDAISARKRVMDWRREGYLNELESGDYEIEGVQLPRDYVHGIARQQAIDEFYTDFGAMRDVLTQTDSDSDAVRAIDTFLTKHRPDIANSLRNQNPNYFGWDTRGKWQYALDAMGWAEGLLNAVDGTLGFMPRGIKTSIRNRATELRVAEGQINIPPSIRDAYRRAVARDFPVVQDEGGEQLVAAPAAAAFTERYPFIQWTLRAQKAGGGDPYQDKVLAPTLEQAQEKLAEQMRALGDEPKSFAVINKERARPAEQGGRAAPSPSMPSPAQLQAAGVGDEFVTVSQDIARFARQDDQEAFDGVDVADVRRRLGFRNYWDLFPSYTGDEVSDSLLQDVGRLAVGGISGEEGAEAELFAREGAANIAATLELPLQATRALVEEKFLRDQMSLEGLADLGLINLPDLNGRTEAELLSEEPELAAQVAQARQRLSDDFIVPEEQLPGQTQFLAALAESGLAGLLPGDLQEDVELFLPEVADPTDFAAGEMIAQLGSDLADFPALAAIGSTGRTLMGSSPIPGLTRKGAKVLERLQVQRLKEASAVADELGLPKLTDQMRNDAMRLARVDFTQAREAAKESGRVLTDVTYARTPEGRLQREVSALEPFDSKYVPRAVIETASEPNQLRNIIELKLQSERLTPSAGPLLRRAVATPAKKVTEMVVEAAEAGSTGAQVLRAVASGLGTAGSAVGKAAVEASRATGMGWRLANTPSMREAIDEIQQAVARRARSQEQLDEFTSRYLRGAPEIEGGLTTEAVKTAFDILEEGRNVVLNKDILKSSDGLEAFIDALRAVQDEVLGGNWLKVLGDNADQTVRVMRDGQMQDMTLREVAEQLQVLRGRQLTRELMAKKLGAFQTSAGDLSLEAIQGQKPELVADYINSFVDNMSPFYESLLRLDEAPLIEAVQQRMIDAMRGSELARDRARELKAALPKVQRVKLPKDADPALRRALEDQDKALNKIQAEASRIEKLADDHELKALELGEEIRTTLRADLRDAKSGFQQSKRLRSGAERLERYMGATPKRFDTFRDFVQDGINRRTQQRSKLVSAETQTTTSVLRAQQLKKEIDALKSALGGKRSKLKDTISEMRKLAKKASDDASAASLAVDKRINRKRVQIDKARKAARDERKRARAKRAEGGRLSKSVSKQFRDAAAVQYAERKAARAAAEADVRAANDESLVLSASAAEARKELRSIDKDLKARARERAELEAYEEWNLPAILNEPVRGRRQMALDEFAADLADAPIGLARPGRDADLATALEAMPLAPEATRARRWFFKAKLEGTKTPKTGYVSARTELEARKLAAERIKRMKRKVEGELEVTPPKSTKLEQQILAYERIIESATGVQAEFLDISAQLAGKTPKQIIDTLWERMDEAVQFDLQLANMTGGTYSAKLGEVMRSMEKMTDQQKFVVTDLVKDRARAKAITGQRRAGETEKEFRARVAKMRRRYTQLAPEEERLLPLVKYFETYFSDYLVKLQKNGILKDWDLYNFLDKNDVSGYVHRTLSRAGVGQTRQVEAAYRRASGRPAVMNVEDSPILQARGIPGTRSEIDDLMRWHVAESIVRHNGNLKPNQLTPQREVLRVYRELPQDVNFFESNPFVAAATYGQHASKSIAMKIMFDDLLAIGRARFEYADLANQASQGRKILDPRTGQPIPQERAALDQWARLAGEEQYGQPIVRVTGPEYVSLLTGTNFPVGKDAAFDYMGVMIANGAKESEVLEMMKSKFGIELTSDQARLATMGDVYLPQDVATFLKAWSRPSMKQMLRGYGSTGGKGAEFATAGAAALDLFDNTTALFKGYVTVVWPRFHGRNQIGGQFQNKMLYGSNYTMKDQADALLLNMPVMDARVIRAPDGSEVVVPGTKQIRIDLGGPNRDPSLRSANLTIEEWQAVFREHGVPTYGVGSADLQDAIQYYKQGAGLAQLKQLPAKTRREVEGFLDRLRDVSARTADEGWKPVVWDELITDIWKRLKAEAKGSRIARGDFSGEGGKLATATGVGAVVAGTAATFGATAATPVLGIAATGAIVGALSQLTGKQLFRLGAEIARMSENHVRSANFLAGVRSGLTFEEAARNVNRALFNYSPAAQSWFSYEIMRRLHPFWTFRSKNFALYSELALQYPERMAVLEKLLANFTHHDGAAELKAGLPDYLRRRLTVYLGDGAFLAGLGLPVEDIVEALRPTGNVPLPGAAGLIPTNPILTTGLELLFDQSIYFERPITEIRSAKSLQEWPRRLGGDMLREFVGYGEVDGVPKVGREVTPTEDKPLLPESPEEAAQRMYLLKRLDVIQLIELHRKFRASAFQDAIGELPSGSAEVGGFERFVNITTGAKTYPFDEQALREATHRNMKNFLLDGWQDIEEERFRDERSLKRRQDQRAPQEQFLEQQAQELIRRAPLEVPDESPNPL